MTTDSAIAQVDVAQLIHAVERSRRDFAYYMEFVHGWKPRKHQLPLVQAIQALGDDTLIDEAGAPTRRLLVPMPPGSGKTRTLIQASCWLMGREMLDGRDPAMGIMSYNDQSASNRSLAIRDTLESNEWYRLVFSNENGPLAQPWKERGWGQGLWFLKRISVNADFSDPHPTCFAAGFEGGVLGYRITTGLLIDDPHNISGTRTPGQLQETWDTYMKVADTRLMAGAWEIMPMTRWHRADMAGRVMDIGGWKVVRIPALLEDAAGKLIDPPQSYWPWEGGELGVTTAALLAKRAADRQAFNTQYMCLPPSAEAALFRYWNYAPEPPIDKVERVYQVWDTAMTKQSWSSYSAMTEWLKVGNKAFQNNAVRGKYDPTELKRKAVELYRATEERYPGKTMVLAENLGGGTQLVAELRRIGIPSRAPNPRRDVKKNDLIERASSVIRYFESGQVSLPEWAPWRGEYEEELRSFPASDYDDYVSSTVLALENIFPHAYAWPTINVRLPWEGW